MVAVPPRLQCNYFTLLGFLLHLQTGLLSRGKELDQYSLSPVHCHVTGRET